MIGKEFEIGLINCLISLCVWPILTFNYSGSRNTSGGAAGLIVPEPATLSLIGFGALGLLAYAKIAGDVRRWSLIWEIPVSAT